jgi:hypothetical protein
MATKCTADGCPMITTQAATVLAAFRHLARIVAVKASDQSVDALQNIATAAASLDPRVVIQMMQDEEDPDDAEQVVRAIGDAFDDTKVAQLLATALAADGQVTDRLADVFDTIAPDTDRKRRVLTMTRTLLSESSFGQTRQFKAIWSSMEELLISYDDKPFTSATYRAQLDGAATRGAAAAGRDLPEELPEWVETLGQENVRKLSVVLIIDLLKLETEAARAAEIAHDMTALAEDLLMSGDYDEARAVAAALSEAAGNPKCVAHAACREALDKLAHSAALHETVAILGELDAGPLSVFADVCGLLGPASVDTLIMTLKMADRSPALERGSRIIIGFGASRGSAAGAARGRRAAGGAVQPRTGAGKDRGAGKRCPYCSRCFAATIPPSRAAPSPRWRTSTTRLPPAPFTRYCAPPPASSGASSSTRSYRSATPEWCPCWCGSWTKASRSERTTRWSWTRWAR